ncbi:hypothetical protein ACFFWD_34350 [Bradyrhizobium erythrophlei]|uniref:hypothetical protein n=1 Tax=Bradyrhizobium erythrophlei TaxID=1437360 RepID=UPI0035E65C8E
MKYDKNTVIHCFLGSGREVSMPYQIPSNVRAILDPLAEAVLPVAAWVAQKAPPNLSQFIPALASVPWRPPGPGPALSVAAMGIVRYLELLVDADADNEALAPRWRQIKADPLSKFQCRTGQTAAEWRAGRQGLSAAARFGAFDPDSSNFAFVTVGADGSPKDAVSRRDFYELCWGPLAASYEANPPSGSAGWISFRESLRSDSLPNWPRTNAVRSSGFVVQFTIDVLNGCLGQKNGAISAGDPLLQRAVLIEIGENRTPANAYSVDQADTAVSTFVNTIQSAKA